MTDPELPEPLASRLRAESDARGIPIAALIPEVIQAGLDAAELEEYGTGQTSGAHLSALLLGSDHVAVSVYPDADEDEDDGGERGRRAQERDIAAVTALLRRHGLGELAPHAVREFDVGYGAEGELATWIQLAESMTAIFGLVGAPAAAYLAWKAVLPDIRGWLKERRGRASIAFAKACCLEDAQSRVDTPEELVPAIVDGHCSALPIAMVSDSVPIGPYCITIPVAERASVFVYVTDEVGTILHFHEVPAKEASEVVAEEVERVR